MGVDGLNSADIFDEYFDDEKPKYIIKNCPSFDTVDFGYCNTIKVDEQRCKDCANCLLKRIYQNLKQVALSGQCDNCDGCGYYNGCGDTECGMYQALKSIELLEIEDENEQLRKN